MLLRIILCSAIAVWFTGMAMGQEQLPEMEQLPDLEQLPPVVDYELFEPAEFESIEEPVQRFRKGFFQRLEFTGSWIQATNDNDLSIGHAQTSVAVAVPLPPG